MAHVSHDGGPLRTALVAALLKQGDRRNRPQERVRGPWELAGRLAEKAASTYGNVALLKHQAARDAASSKELSEGLKIFQQNGETAPPPAPWLNPDMPEIEVSKMPSIPPLSPETVTTMDRGTGAALDLTNYGPSAFAGPPMPALLPTLRRCPRCTSSLSSDASGRRSTSPTFWPTWSPNSVASSVRTRPSCVVPSRVWARTRSPGATCPASWVARTPSRQARTHAGLIIANRMI